MRGSLKDISVASIKKFTTMDKETWILGDPAQVVLLINVCNWVILCEKAFVSYNGGDKQAIEKAFEQQKEDLKNLIMLVQGNLTKPQRQKVMCLITMDAHSRDIIN
jgi:dynein heavy chain